MATIALGLAGAAVGSAFGNPYAGFMIGSTIGSLLDPNSPHLDANRISDLRYSGSAYGNAIPRVWGYTRVAGNIIWVARDSNGNHLLEHSSTSGGGKGSPSVTTYTYTASVAVALAAGTITMPDGSQVNRNVQLKRLWADDKVVYDSAAAHNPAVNLTFYPGTETQAVDALIASKEGTTNTPAYRGMSYVVLTDFLLTDFGNRIPNFSAELTTDDVTVGDVFQDLARQSGLSASELDITAATTTLTGLTLPSRAPAQDAANAILAAYNLDAAEVDGILKLVPRGQDPTESIDEQDLGCNNPQTKIELTRALESELPGRVDITYFDTDRNLQQATQSAVRQSSANTQNAASLNLNLSLTATAARQIAATALDNAWQEVEQYSFNLSHKYSHLAPGDVVLLNFDGNQRRARITGAGISDEAELRFTAVQDDPATLIQTIQGDPGQGGPVTAPPVTVSTIDTEFVVWSSTEIRDRDLGKPGFYLAATGADGWKGCNVYYSADGGTTWVHAGETSKRATFGQVAAALPDATTALTFDDTDTPTVTLVSGELDSYATDHLLERADKNIAVFGSEILGYGAATLTGTLQYQLGHLYRGMRGSSMTGHLAADLFVVADNAVLRVPVDDGYVGQTLQVKAITRYEQLSDVTAKSVTIGARTPTAVEQDVAALQTTVATIQTQVTATATDLASHETQIAGAATLGHVKVGSGLAIDGAGVLSSTASGTAGGDLTGAYPNPSVAKINGNSVPSGAALGDVLYGSGPNAFSILNGNTASTKKFLRQTGTGSVSAVPAWDTLAAGDIPSLDASKITTGTLPVANGGTGQTSFTDGQLLIGNSSGNTLSKASLTAGSNISITNGAGSITISGTGATVPAAGTLGRGLYDNGSAWTASAAMGANTIPFMNGSQVLGSSSNLKYDSTNGFNVGGLTPISTVYQTTLLGGLEVRRAGGTGLIQNTSDTFATAGSGVASYFTGYVVGGTNYLTSGIAVSAAENHSSSALGSSMLFNMPKKTTNSRLTRFILDSEGNVVTNGNQVALPTSATDGFLNVATMPGAPTGSATSYAGNEQFVYDTANKTAWWNNGASNWDSVGPGRVIRTVTNANVTMTRADDIILWSLSASGARTCTLPAANAAPPGKVYTIMCILNSFPAASVNIVPAGSDTINGASSKAIGTQYASYSFFSDGSSKWYVQSST